LRRTASFGVSCVKIRSGALALASCKNPSPLKKTNTFWCAIWRAKSLMRRNEIPGQIVTNFCTGVGVHNVITYANIYDSHIRGFGVVGGQILGFSIDLHRRPYNTLARIRSATNEQKSLWTAVDANCWCMSWNINSLVNCTKHFTC